MSIIRGMDELKRNTERVNKELTRIIPIALEAGALIIQNDASDKAPYRTGTLRRSIHTEMRSNTQVVVGTDVEYAVYQEFGTSKMKAHPYLRPALDENREKVLDKINKVIKRLLFK